MTIAVGQQDQSIDLVICPQTYGILGNPQNIFGKSFAVLLHLSVKQDDKPSKKGTVASLDLFEKSMFFTT